MMGLASRTYDPNGAIILDARPSNLYSAFRRGTVTATLDGRVSVYDGGYSIADQTIKATLHNVTSDMLARINYLIAYYQQLVVCVETGAFLCSVSLEVSKSSATISCRIIERI